MEINKPVDKIQVGDWFKKNIIPKISTNIDKNWNNVTVDISIPENSFFLSTVYFIEIKFVDEQKSIKIVIKKPSGMTTMSENMHTRQQFHNEILFYNNISTASKRYPKCYYAFEDKYNVDNTIIVTENIETMGYKMCPVKYDIPFEYVIAGVEEIARFHAMSYIMKLRDPKKFYSICNEIEETRYEKDDWHSKYINLISQRPIKWLKKEKFDPKFCEKIEKYFENAYGNIMITSLEVKEPLAVFCHGDFTRNNILFRHSKNNNIEGKLIDFAMLRYASPSIDLSTFLYISVSNSDRKHRFDEIFNAYYQSMTKYFEDEKMEIPNYYSYDVFVDDYKRKAMFGYIIAIFFLPLLREHVSLNDINEEDFFNPEIMAAFSEDAGGDSLSREFADMLLEIRNFGGLDHVQDF
ncbi:uncharacterized protein LOC122851272 [Aphidius gifuensis]|uniref:uncharacterized protein LOC122851272 n=1 Tax=Aphidius gifuensis TaxID=684658 RepID=UPI001CDB6D53|nr:uncharacterized protein LOC122851272 [Aphidius gifuensis]